MSVSRINRIILSGALLSLAVAASGCSSIDRLSQIGEKPRLTEIENPTTQPGYKPVQMPMPKPEQASYNANSLWRNGSRCTLRQLGCGHGCEACFLAALRSQVSRGSFAERCTGTRSR